MVIKTAIEEKLVNAISTLGLEVLNESYMHNVPDGSETHFKVIIISNDFENKTKLERHRLVNNFLRDEFESSLHSITFKLMTINEN